MLPASYICFPTILGSSRGYVSVVIDLICFPPIALPPVFILYRFISQFSRFFRPVGPPVFSQARLSCRFSPELIPFLFAFVVGCTATLLTHHYFPHSVVTFCLLFPKCITYMSSISASCATLDFVFPGFSAPLFCAVCSHVINLLSCCVT